MDQINIRSFAQIAESSVNLSGVAGISREEEKVILLKPTELNTANYFANRNLITKAFALSKSTLKIKTIDRIYGSGFKVVNGSDRGCEAVKTYLEKTSDITENFTIIMTSKRKPQISLYNID
ncbi:hypothetical protein AVEN_198052-1 [Araneus ventricosus]|uniref:Uncharacterized protein n=1 Tax=Araneus ventricosus TaxID=182803 RepID=A0A4Y2NWK3_ARAVE|nr:hypothetical protein AVEN_198052-1 [Araneus ventricosus]